MVKILYAVLTALAVQNCTLPARADDVPPSNCAPRAEFAAALTAKYHESLSTIGIENRGALIELWVSADGTTWTMLVSGSNGQSCVVAAGTQWKAVLPPGAPL